MTPQEKDLIQSVFDRLRNAGTGQKDAEAEALIRDNVQRVPDATYGLVQAVIVQEIGLNQANARIAELQRQLDEARAGAGRGAATGGSFLGGASPWGGASVPQAGSAPPPRPQAAPQPGWGQPQQAYAPPPPAAPAWGQPAAQPPMGQQPSPVGGFLRNAATMAAGVAGGTLIAEGLSSMFGGHHFGGGFGGGLGSAGFGGSPWGGGAAPVENVTVNNYYEGDRGQPADDRSSGQDADNQQDDAGYQEASYDDTSDDSGFDGGYDDTQDV